MSDTKIRHAVIAQVPSALKQELLDTANNLGLTPSIEKLPFRPDLVEALFKTGNPGRTEKIVAGLLSWGKATYIARRTMTMSFDTEVVAGEPLYKEVGRA